MTTVTLGLNHTGSANRIRFEKLSERLQNINIDVLHRIRDNDRLDPNNNRPKSGDMGCFFQDELQHCFRMDTSQHFRRYLRIDTVSIVKKTYYAYFYF